MEAKKRTCLILAVLLSLSGVQPAAATDDEVADYLPLAVGNSWTYRHSYDNQGPFGFEDRLISLYPVYFLEAPLDKSSNFPLFTIEVLRTEVIDGKTYYVISDMPANWPPAPPHFIAGKKLRWEGTHLMERTADGERSMFRFDGADDAGYTVLTSGLDHLDYPDGSDLKSLFTLTYGGDTLVTTRVFSDPVGFYSFYFHTEPVGQNCAFVKSYGCNGCG